MDYETLTIQDLYNREGWVSFVFPDQSLRYLRTTLNPEVLKAVPGGILEGKLYDLEKFVWVDLPQNPEVQLLVTTQKPRVSEVDEFVNRFV